MRQRLLSAAVLVPVVLLVFVLGQPWLTLALAVLAALGGWEAARLAKRAGLWAQPALTAAVAAAATVALPALARSEAVGSEAIPGHVLASLAGVAVAAGAMISFAPAVRRARRLTLFGSLVALLYPALLAVAAGVVSVGAAASPASPLVSLLDPGRAWLLVLLLTVWTLDSGAYVVGRMYPRGRFFNAISPRKTWSGAIGGTAVAVVVCLALVWSLGHDPLGGALLGLLIAIAAQAGDLTESMLKRAAGAKDSGELIPGHGGILDRTDSFLFAAPAMFIALTWPALLILERPA